MKQKISPEIDRLMWLVAEENSLKATEDFGQRFPDLRPELGKRLAMVRSLRGMNESGLSDSIPAFQLRQPPAPAITPRLALLSFAILSAAIALGTYAVVSNRTNSRTAIGPVVSISTEMPTLPPNVQVSPHLTDPTPEATVPPIVPPEPSPVMPTDLPEYMQPQEFAFHKTRLSRAIAMVALAGHFSVELAPGLPDIDITVSYPRCTPVEALKRLGEDYGFTPFAQERAKVLIVPATDTASTPTPETKPEATPAPTSH